METKFTPGPWVAVNSLNNNTTRVKAKNFGFVAEIIEFGKETDANAHLISAAPEMYALIKKIDAHLVRPDKLGDLIDEAERVLAKARGES